MHVVFAQSRTVTGTVTDADDGGTLPGVSVVVKGTSMGTVTDIDGKFTLNVTDDAGYLMFSFVGMTTIEVELTSASNYDVAMEKSDIAVSEVVVTALGVSRAKKSLGYASQGVNADEIMSTNDISPISSLSGKVAGLTVSGQNFSGSQNILIRGASSFSQNNQPLFVVDGIPISNDNFNSTNTQIGGGGYDYGSMINDLNSYDVESVEVLKGSAASALYGSRGQNGVIMITTKNGKKGAKTFSVEVNSGINMEQVSIIPELQTEYGGGYGDFETVNIDGKDYEVVYYAMDESWGPKYDPNREVLHWWGIADYEQGLTDSPVTAPWVAPENDVDAFYELGVSYQNSVNVVNTTKNSALRIGYTNVDMTGIVPNSMQKKNSFNINGSTSLFNGVLELSSNVSYVNTYTKGRPQFGYGDNSQSQKFFQWGQRQLDMNKLAWNDGQNPDGTNRTWNRVSWDNPTPKYSDNPYWTAYKNYQDDDRTRIFGKTSAKIKLTDYLSASGTIYHDTYTFKTRVRSAKGSQAMSSYGESIRQSSETNLEGKLDFNKSFGDVNVLAMLGGNQRIEEFKRLTGSTNGGIVIDDLWTVNNSVNQALVDAYESKMQVNSIFASASVGYQDMFYVDGTFRKDYDSSLPTGNNSYSYSSVSASAILSELIDNDNINNLKLRANYGETGMGTGVYQVFNVYTIGDPFGGSPQFTNSSRLKNQDLVPEKTSEIEAGLEGAMFNNRLYFDISVYNRNTSNQIVPVEISGATGYTSRVINAGKINNKGLEILVQGTPVKTKDFAWNVSVNWAKNVNTVLELPEGLDKIQLARAPFGGAYLNAVEGATFQELYGYDFIYDDAGNKVVGASGMYVTSGELTSLGSVLPDWTGGLRNSISYKSFDASALIDASIGGVYYSLTNMWSMYSGMAAATATPTTGGNTIREDGIVLDGVNGDVSYDDEGNAVVSNATANDIVLDAESYGAYHYHGYGTPSATSIFDATYIKLREVSLGYTLPKFSNVVKDVRISLYGRNLAVWGLDNGGIDPETIVGGSGNIQGLEGGIVPATRSFGFNLKINF